ncbi:hypothetical protein NDU88_009562 [Pleurodeles waltl]|uniref:Uncharacterized protein n=1 Tax=Pleurodeles waltl TaxID=8319 RepID=A0AAV7P143_PLEWA|nr:hypothetical protein NDU88_009562 [Pleurodeles waltl]
MALGADSMLAETRRGLSVTIQIVTLSRSALCTQAGSEPERGHDVLTRTRLLAQALVTFVCILQLGRGTCVLTAELSGASAVFLRQLSRSASADDDARFRADADRKFF